MFLLMLRLMLANSSFPRIRGDVPSGALGGGGGDSFSPHTRGCSASTHREDPSCLVFPAYAGMFRLVTGGESTPRSFPRIRGDVPGASITAGATTRVFPAYAGMFRRKPTFLCLQHGFPRIRGDVPPPRSISQSEMSFSPHTRGCSSMCHLARSTGSVFPAYAGMFRNS